MRVDQKKKFLVKAVKWSVIGGFVCDAALLGTGYFYYNQLKNSPDFRRKVYTYDSRYIDLYYRANERYGDGKARKQDYSEWGITKVDSFSFTNMFGL